MDSLAWVVVRGRSVDGRGYYTPRGDTPAFPFTAGYTYHNSSISSSKANAHYLFNAPTTHWTVSRPRTGDERRITPTPRYAFPRLPLQHLRCCTFAPATRSVSVVLVFRYFLLVRSVRCTAAPVV